MSGIIAYTGSRAAAPLLLDGLRQLLHHGHDSAGLALLHRGRLRRWRALAPLATLEHRVPAHAAGHCGIAHTRLATHGAPSEDNAHPQLGGERIALVHNGVVENADALRRMLHADGVCFRSQTDSEVIAQLLARRLDRHGETLERALRTVLQTIIGPCGIAALDRDAPARIVVARVGSPMLVGRIDDGTFAASDAAALRGRASELVALADGEIASLTPSGFEIATSEAYITADTDAPSQGSTGVPEAIATAPEARSGARSATITGVSGDERGDRHDSGSSSAADRRLHDEILEQPAAVRRALAGRLDRRFASVRLGGLNLEPAALRAFRRVHLLGCGSAWHAALSGAHMIESLARLPATAESAGEFLFRDPIIERDTLYLVASRSGETADTLAALREIRRRGGTVLGVVNRVGSPVAREVHGGVYLHAGEEHAVVATKTVSAMLTVFALLALHLGRLRDVSPQRGARLLDAFDALPAHLEEVLAGEARLASLARDVVGSAASVLFIGRAAGHAIALEGARKLAEASAVHAAACPAAELAHGPIALLGADTPCVVLLPEPDLLPLSLSSLERVKARGAPLVVLGDADEPRVAELADHFVRIPRTEPLLQPIVAGAALQLLACHAGITLGRDVDRPRSLAGRVTGEER